MNRWAHFFKTKADSLHLKIENLLTESPGNRKMILEIGKKDFELSTDLTGIDYAPIEVPDEEADRAFLFFSKLIPHFDSGFLFEKENGRWSLQALFNSGELVVHDQKTSALEIDLPEISLYDIRKSNADVFLEQVNLKNFQKHPEAEAFLLRLSYDFAVVGITQLPEIWLKSHLAKIRDASLKHMAL
ncbi:MAG: hypothetical protein AB7O96_11560 [Pseudobdellovibrionaceae bacterium]